MHHYLGHDTSLADYTSGRYSTEISELEKQGVEPSGLSHRRLTSMVNLQMAQFSAQIASQYSSSVQARYARDVSTDDLRKYNVILSGSQSANPWIELYQGRLNFVFDKGVVRNVHPQAGELAEYPMEQPPDHFSYGVLAFLPGLDSSKNILIMEGTTLPGTEAITDLLFEQKDMEELLHGLRNSDGTLKHFEILLASSHFNGKAGNFHIVAERSYP